MCLCACFHNSTSTVTVCRLCAMRLVDSFQHVSAGGGGVFYAKCCFCLSVNVVFVYAATQKRGRDEGEGSV